MGTCTTCGGAGQIPSGQYDPCYSCGGSGHGSHTDVPCMACNGSGHSGSQRYDTCWNCHGAGSTPDPKPIVRPKTQVKTSKPAKQTNNTSKTTGSATPTTKKPNNLSQNISQVAIVLAIIILIAASDNLEGGEFIFAGLGAFFASYVALYVLYYVAIATIELLKIALKIAAAGLVILVIIGLFNESKAEAITPSVSSEPLIQFWVN
ncbi:MAG: hypothetical protein D9N11_09740 [Ketobacter sp.]|nr:MAG: hypothetical protein D9N11_09740 [Ketobacter sp.]